MRILITGSRDWPNDNSVGEKIAAVIALAMATPYIDTSHVTIVHGACPTGADDLANEYVLEMIARGRPISAETHPANWERDGRSAGFKRNQEMVDLGADICIAFLGPCRKHPDQDHQSHGAQHTADAAHKAGIPVVPVVKTY